MKSEVYPLSPEHLPSISGEVKQARRNRVCTFFSKNAIYNARSVSWCQRKAVMDLHKEYHLEILNLIGFWTNRAGQRAEGMLTIDRGSVRGCGTSTAGPEWSLTSNNYSKNSGNIRTTISLIRGTALCLEIADIIPTWPRTAQEELQVGFLKVYLCNWVPKAKVRTALIYEMWTSLTTQKADIMQTGYKARNAHLWVTRCQRQQNEKQNPKYNPEVLQRTTRQPNSIEAYLLECWEG